jgi:RsiW-degrading membrane proteinase PrsW (M82 family)
LINIYVTQAVFYHMFFDRKFTNTKFIIIIIILIIIIIYKVGYMSIIEQNEMNQTWLHKRE